MSSITVGSVALSVAIHVPTNAGYCSTSRPSQCESVCLVSTSSPFMPYRHYLCHRLTNKVICLWSLHDLLVRERSALSDPYCQSTWNSVCLLVRECSALADPYCHLAWNSVGVFVGLFVCPQLWGQISRKPKELEGKLLWGAYRKVVRGFRMVTSPMTSVTLWRHNTFQNASSPSVLVQIRPYYNIIIYCIVRPNDPHG